MTFDWVNPLYAYIGLGGTVVAACVVVAIYFPPFRKIAVIVGGAVIAVLAAYTKGSRDNAALESRRKEEAVRKARKEYDEIEARPDSSNDVVERLRKNGF